LRAAAIAVAAALLMVSAGGSQSTGLVIRDVTVVSPERRTPLTHAYVRLSGNRIAEISQRALAGEREISGADRFLVPGLIDSHVHLVQPPPGMTFGQDASLPEVGPATRAQEPRSYLFFGFTTVIDLNGTAEKNATWNAAPQRPDAFFCGAAPVANGFPMNFLPAEFRFRIAKYFLYDPRQAERIPSSVDPPAHTPAAVVAAMAADHATCVKAHYEPGGLVSGPLPTPTLEMFRGLVAAGRAHHLPVVIHANTRVGQRRAVDAGATIITHTIADGVGPDGRLTAEVDAILGEIASRRIGFQPTLRALYGQLALVDPAYLQDPRVADAVPAALLAWLSTEDGQRFRRTSIAGAGGEERFRTLLVAREAAYARVLSRLVGSNAQFLFGSDSPATASYGNLPGLNSRLEMDHWIAAGVSLTRLFRAMTIDNAQAFGLERERGTIETGKRADLLLLRANPLDTVRAYDAIDLVIQGGVPMARDTLSARRF
jgi:imidazolonepropionase-like amidohydrolase